jgi:hypothetical protein
MVVKKPAAQHARTAFAMAVVIIGVAIASLLYFQRMNLKVSEVYRNVTFTDALLACREYTDGRYGANLKQLVLDDHSSRWEQKDGVYKLFFKATLVSVSHSSSQECWVSCAVSGDTGEIRDYDLIEDKSLKTEAQRRDDGNIFGWP